MSNPHDEQPFTDGDDLQQVADMLRNGRPTLDPLSLDRVKLRAMSGARRPTSIRDKGFSMRSRLTTILTVAFLAVGTGGALALNGGDFGGGNGGSASFHQYRPPCPHGDRHDGNCGHEGGGKGGDGGGGDKGGHGGGGGGGDKGGHGGGGGDKGGHGGGGGGGDKGGHGGGGGGDKGGHGGGGNGHGGDHGHGGRHG